MNNTLKKTILTRREQEIHSWVADGYCTKEIAERLCISTHTVYNHRRNILRKVRWGKREYQ